MWNIWDLSFSSLCCIVIYLRYCGKPLIPLQDITIVYNKWHTLLQCSVHVQAMTGYAARIVNSSSSSGCDTGWARQYKVVIVKRLCHPGWGSRRREQTAQQQSDRDKGAEHDHTWEVDEKGMTANCQLMTSRSFPDTTPVINRASHSPAIVLFMSPPVPTAQLDVWLVCLPE